MCYRIPTEKKARDSWSPKLLGLINSGGGRVNSIISMIVGLFHEAFFLVLDFLAIHTFFKICVLDGDSFMVAQLYRKCRLL